MQKSNEDCFYFLTSTCAKGPSCSYRHNPTVLTCNVICPAWSRGNCPDPACAMRHSTIQRPAISNGPTCFFESTPMGCLKLDCTFVHLRSRPNSRSSPSSRPSTTNLINKEVIKPAPPLPMRNLPTSTVNEPVLPTSQVTPPPAPAPKIETPIPKIETSAPAKSSEKNSDDTKAFSQVVVNRNVVVAEPSRKVVQGTTSNRVVVSSDSIKSSKKPSNDSDSDFDDLIEQENESTRTTTLIDISFPCSAPSITSRLFTSPKPSIPTNDTKPIRLNRDRLPAAKNSSPNSIFTLSNGEKTSAGTGLVQDDERRTSRIERFKQKPPSPPRVVVNTSSPSTRNVINSSPNERKRPATDQTTNDSPPSKRLSSQQESNHHHHNSATIGDLCSPPSSPRRAHTRHKRRRRSSSSPSPPPQRKPPLRPTYSATSSMNEFAWKREVDEFLAKTVQSKPVPLLSLRPRYIPPPQHAPLPPPLMSCHRPRQPLPMAIKRPVAPVNTPPEVPTKPVEQVASTPAPSPPTSKEDDENRLLESTDIADTFDLIDEILLETGDLLELL